MPPLAYVAGAIELALVLVGIVLLWRLVLSPAARANRRPSPLPAWNLAGTEFLLFLLFVLLGSVGFAAAGSTLARQLGLLGDRVTVFVGAAAQLGMLTGVGLFHAWRKGSLREPVSGGPGVLISGVAAFLVALPILIVSAKAWEIFLRLSGLPVDRQDLIGIFAAADTPLMLGVLIVLAVVVAPITEELVFRAGLYRFLRTRIPQLVALVLPAVFFAALHVNWDTLQGLSSLVPLVVLAIVFSLAYERTGKIGTAMVAHALFNLNTVLLILSGVTV